MGLNKPRVTVKLFNKEANAVEWCLNQIPKSVSDEK
jgi:hypothetical protein